MLICALANILLVCASTLEVRETITPLYNLSLYAKNFALTLNPFFNLAAKISGICKSHNIFLESSSVSIIESVPNIDELMPRVPTVPEKGAIIFLSCSFAIISPFFAALNFNGSNNSLFLILKEVVLLLKAVQ